MPWFFLVGFMGAGKTTLGAAVAERMSLSFVDLDEAIAHGARMSVPEIFEAEGEAKFRERETDALRRVVAGGPPGVVATGGGTFTIEENRRIMKDSGVSVWLDAPMETIALRVDGERRPLWKSPAEARALFEARKEYYCLADHRLELGTEAPGDAAARLHGLLAPYLTDSDDT